MGLDRIEGLGEKFSVCFKCGKEKFWKALQNKLDVSALKSAPGGCLSPEFLLAGAGNLLGGRGRGVGGTRTALCPGCSHALASWGVTSFLSFFKSQIKG